MDNQRRIGKYLIGETLGQGGFSKVKLGINVETRERVALKILKKDKLVTSSSVQRQVEREVAAMQKIQHPNVIRLFDVDWNAKYPKKNGSIIEVILVVLELATGGELFEFLSFTGSFEENIARTYFHQLISGVEACHSQRVSHRDLKPENLLLDGSFVLKLADFGFSNVMSEQMRYTFTECGTPGYMAPEMLTNRGYDPAGADVWACGVIIFIMVAGFPPFQRPQDNDWWFDKLAKGKHALFWQAHCRSARFSEEFKDLINRVLQPNPAQRLNLEGIKNHVWFQGSTIVQQQLTNEFARRKVAVDAERAKAKFEKKGSVQMSGDSLEATVTRGHDPVPVAPSADDIPAAPPAYASWKAVAADAPPMLNRPPSSTTAAAFSDSFSDVETKVIPEPAQYNTEEHVSVYTRFYSNLNPVQTLSKVSNVLSDFQGFHNVIDESHKIKGRLSNEHGVIHFQAQVFIDPAHPSTPVCVFKRLKGDSIQFREAFQAIIASLAPIIVDPNALQVTNQ